ncbi:ABC-F family ATP-binding cassette domain-containing protein [Saxibacter everestensis]|uniref:ABC-F family ATP-binding cassette domain-containing protein n=1 Tax=Saxibacter everestensis TaxID=2909229 RepID=A0ABY8QVE0_9MICO|nr:ABC-F family ATP-binding cassette domain-containing protein [Brevibacteriaceae bacterium ZFBP1038]
MAPLINAENLSVTFVTRTILDGVSLGVEEGERIGVVGRNGDGKSTLLRILAGRAMPDSGRVSPQRGLSIGFLDQQDVLDGTDSVRHAVVGDVDDHVWATEARIRDVISGLLADVDWASRVSTLSGGQKRRVALAKLLIGDHDLLLLDEPTNHLDVEGVAWLARHLKSRWPAQRGGFVVVTHDRWFLDEVTARTWEVHDGLVDIFEGGYAAYVLARTERDRAAAVEESRRQNLMRKELAWLRRGAPARTSKPKFRLDAAAELIANEPPPRDSVALHKMATARQGKDVVDVENVSYSLDDGTVIFDDVTFRLGPGDRYGVVGVNGAGKTTLFKLITGALSPGSGRIKRGKTLQPAMLSQEVRELDDVMQLRTVEVIRAEREFFTIGGQDVSAGQLVERLGFTRERAWTRVADLSGGERRRLQMLRLLVGEPNLLLLDEPTNDLDTDTLAALEDLLDGWPGTLLVISHDRYLLERVTDRQVALLGDGAIRDLPGGVDEYLSLRESAMGGARKDGHALSSAGSRAATTEQSTTANAGATSAADQRTARKELARIERQLQKSAEREEKLHAEMAELAQTSDFEAVAKLDVTLRELSASRDALEEEWLILSEALD